MDNFKAVYKILTALERAMDYPEFDAVQQIGPDALGVTPERWGRYIEMMVDVGYIKGASISRDILGETHVNVKDARITLKGLEYLQENSIMRRLYQAAQGVKEISPGLLLERRERGIYDRTDYQSDRSHSCQG